MAELAVPSLETGQSANGQNQPTKFASAPRLNGNDGSLAVVSSSDEFREGEARLIKGGPGGCLRYIAPPSGTLAG